MALLKTLFIDLDGNPHDTGAEVPSEGAWSVYPYYEGTRYRPLGSVHGRMIFVAMTEEQWEATREARAFVGVTPRK